MSEPIPEGMNPEVYQKIEEEYKKGIPEKIAKLKSLAIKLKEMYQRTDLEEIRFIVHKFAGNAATFGYPKVSAECKVWDQKLSQLLETFPQEKKDESFFQELNAFIQTIEKEFQK